MNETSPRASYPGERPNKGSGNTQGHEKAAQEISERVEGLRQFFLSAVAEPQVQQQHPDLTPKIIEKVMAALKRAGEEASPSESDQKIISGLPTADIMKDVMYVAYHGIRNIKSSWLMGVMEDLQTRITPLTDPLASERH